MQDSLLDGRAATNQPTFRLIFNLGDALSKSGVVYPFLPVAFIFYISLDTKEGILSADSFLPIDSGVTS